MEILISFVLGAFAMFLVLYFTKPKEQAPVVVEPVKRKRRTKAELAQIKTVKDVKRERQISEAPELERLIMKGQLESLRKNPSQTYEEQTNE